jgi:hypothetical protein
MQIADYASLIRLRAILIIQGIATAYYDVELIFLDIGEASVADRKPIAFLSYVRSDDDHDEGRITAFRKRLEGEVRMQTGEPFEIFQDRNDIAWGQQWEDRINRSLSDVTFLIPIVTPSFFKSPACRSEFKTFALKEKMLGVNRLILPLYYVGCDELSDVYKEGSDEIADIIRSRNWTDWRSFRFKPFSDENVAAALAGMANMIKGSMKELEAIGTVSAHPQLKAVSTPGLPQLLTEEDISSISKRIEIEPAVTTVPELKPRIKASKDAAAKTKTAPYYAFTKRYDETVEASDLAENAELLKLHAYLVTFSDALRKLHDQNLTKLLSRFVPKKESPSLAVSVLIDNSGSMRGTRIIHTAAWSLLISEWLDRLRIPSEFLGFTTRAWKGGQSRELWLSRGKPANPGRLNDLRHVIYKSFASSIAASAPNFGLMVREGLLKENIDGEALLWAISRIKNQPAERKLLFVVSDGAPVDDSTLSVNPKDFLEKHLRNVIASLSPDIKLIAIGVEYDVSRYYPNALALKEASELGPRFFELLVNDAAFLDSFSSRKPKKRYRFVAADDDE